LRDKFLTLACRASVAILGNGLTAKGIQKLLNKFKLSSVIYDQNPEKGESLDQQKIRQHPIVIGSPSFLSHHPWVRLVHKEKKWYLSELDFAGLWCTAPIIAITGTNGKTTTTSFLTKIFNHCGYRAFSAGNIGYSLSELVATEDLGKEAIVFCETSSFQAENLNFLPLERLIWTNFAPNHLDHHATLEDYFAAKYRLIERLPRDQGEIGHYRLFGGESVVFWAKYFHRTIPECMRCLSPKENLNGTSFDDWPQRENYAIVEDFCGHYEISKDEVYREAISFKRPKYRLECMGIIEDNTYWNDSKCTNFAALKAALGNFPKNSVIWIGGGRSKGENLENIVDILMGNIEQAVLIGETGSLLEPLLLKHHIAAIYVETIDHAINYIKDACFHRKNILFSPGFSSFDQFSDYEMRGKFFEKCIFVLKSSKPRAS
jgi:UDP-N-acetylmuramoylalanine--D-glutamate ligase